MALIPDWLRRMRGETDPDPAGLSPTMAPRDMAFRHGRDDRDITGGLTPALEQIGTYGVLPTGSGMGARDLVSLQPAFGNSLDRTGDRLHRPGMYEPAVMGAARGQADEARGVLDGLEPRMGPLAPPPLRDITTPAEEADLDPRSREGVPGWVKALYLASETLGGVQAGMEGRQHRPGQSPDERLREERERRIAEIARDRADQYGREDRERQITTDTARQTIAEREMAIREGLARRQEAADAAERSRPEILGGANAPKLLIRTPQGITAQDNPAYQPPVDSDRYQITTDREGRQTIFDRQTGRYARGGTGYGPRPTTPSDRRAAQTDAERDYAASPEAEERRGYHVSAARYEALRRLGPEFESREPDEVLAELDAAANPVLPDRKLDPEGYAQAASAARQAEARARRIRAALNAADKEGEASWQRENRRRGRPGGSGAGAFGDVSGYADE